MEKEEKYRTLERINTWIGNSDTKVSFILTLQGVVLSIIFTSSYSKALLETFSRDFSITSITFESVLYFIEGLFLLGFIIFIILSFFFAYQTLRARINPNIFKEDNLVTNSLIFFETIASRTYNKFREDVKAQNDEKLINDIDSQIYINSKICSLKFKNYNLTIKNTGIAVIFGLLYVVIKIINGCQQCI